jgi:16S rRNA (guanine(966)-N(2))-methyltransferase RsmD
MRIIAGQFRSRVLLPPEDDRTTRPITDRVKQSLFDVVTPLLADAVVYDCFAGTGSMGLESLSRGAKRAVFFEGDRSALGRLKRNIASLGVESSSTVVSGDLFKYFQTAARPAEAAVLIFLDPPYRFLREQPERLVSLVDKLRDHLIADGLVVYRHDATDQLALPPLMQADVRTYGGMQIDLLRRPPDAA